MDSDNIRNRTQELVLQHIIQSGMSPTHFNNLPAEQKKMIEEEKLQKIEQKRQELMDYDLQDRMMKDMFYREERTEHKGILPAKERIKQYKIK
mmetsp:Transcript_6749/g.11323  ORF Transcript_6749/g.11323 Transcript_6749/m.11323 type:complete len:93 (+) Transcript_6749:19-297(+)